MAGHLNKTESRSTEKAGAGYQFPADVKAEIMRLCEVHDRIAARHPD